MLCSMEPIRLAIIGNSGSGKTTLARHVEAVRGVPRLELDALFHQQGWTPMGDPEFRRRVTDFLAEHDRWVIDGNYKTVRDLIWEKATSVVWLHPKRSTVMCRLAMRTMRRVLTREKLWNGNREPFSNLYSFDPEHSVLAWAWKSHGVYEHEYGPLLGIEGSGRLPIQRLGSKKEVARYMHSLLCTRSG